MAGLIGGITDAVGLTDSGAAKDSMNRATGLSKEAIRRLAKIDLPDIEKQKILLENPELVGLLEAEQLDPSALENITEDPRMKEYQMQALQNLAERSKTGITQEDKASLEQMLGSVAAQDQSQRAAIEQDMARKGMDTSGASLMSKLQASQNSANQARQQAMQLGSNAAQQRQQALTNLASQSGQMQAQDFNRQSTVASARDAIARANAMNRQDVSGQNLASRQGIENQRANLANQGQMYNKGLLQQQFQNEMTRAGAQNQATGNLAGMYAQQASNQASADANTMSALAGMGSAAISGGATKSDIRVKENIESGNKSIRQLLDKVSPYKYDYKDEVKDSESMEGPQLGIMAQDLEESELGRNFVEEDEDGVKRVDYGKMGSTQMAAIADLHQRIKALEQLLKGNKDE